MVIFDLALRLFDILPALEIYMCSGPAMGHTSCSQGCKLYFGLLHNALSRHFYLAGFERSLLSMHTHVNMIRKACQSFQFGTNFLKVLKVAAEW